MSRIYRLSSSSRYLPLGVVTLFAVVTVFLAFFGNERAAIVPYTLTFPVSIAIEVIDRFAAQWLFEPAAGEPATRNYRLRHFFTYGLYLLSGCSWLYLVAAGVRRFFGAAQSGAGRLTTR